ncbi:hypothetical protein DY000_02023725 [Brassica cretica]|uniref:Uncharacterized protein n=1 Tax=Brassica cretica TaxID=69181 RepID=A0ABQ7EMB1_BRACR|nr:hypothetical protein DY000_02023725 [Brassica cretica]
MDRRFPHYGSALPALWIGAVMDCTGYGHSSINILLHPGQLQLAFPDQTARDPTAISSRNFNSNSFVLPFVKTPSPRLDQHITSSHPFELLLVVRFLQSANKR